MISNGKAFDWSIQISFNSIVNDSTKLCEESKIIKQHWKNEQDGMKYLIMYYYLIVIKNERGENPKTTKTKNEIAKI